MAKIDRIKRRILNTFTDGKIIKIKICKAKKKDCYYMEIGDSKNMDMDNSKGATGWHNFNIKKVLKEIEDEIRSLK